MSERKELPPEEIRQRILERVRYIQRVKHLPENRGLEQSYSGEMTMAIMALGYDPTKFKEQINEQD